MFLFLLLGLLYALPSFGYAAPSAATVAGQTGISYECAPVGAVDSQGNPIKDANGNQIMLYGNCTYSDLISAVSKFTTFAVEDIALPFSVIVIAYAGFLYLTSGGNQAQLNRAHGMFTKVALGIVWVLAAWLIVTLITNALLTPAARQFVPFAQ